MAQQVKGRSYSVEPSRRLRVREGEVINTSILSRNESPAVEGTTYTDQSDPGLP